MDQIRIQNTPGEDQAAVPDNVKVEGEGSFYRVTFAPDMRDPADPKEEPKKEEAKPDEKGQQEPPAQEPKKDERPAWLPEKFKSAEDLAKAYAELEKKLAQQAKPKDEQKPADAKDEKKDEQPQDKKEDEKKDERPPSDPQREEAKAVLKKVNLDIEKFEQEFEETGTLSEDSYKMLEGAGFSRKFVDSYIEGRQAAVKQAMDEVWAVSGGSPESYQEMTKWVSAQGIEAVKEYNEKIMSRDRKAVLAHVKETYEKFLAANGKPGELIQGKASARAAQDSESFKSWDEVMAAMADPRYKEGDRAYHAEVDRKMRNSKL